MAGGDGGAPAETRPGLNAHGDGRLRVNHPPTHPRGTCWKVRVGPPSACGPCPHHRGMGTASGSAEWSFLAPLLPDHPRQPVPRGGLGADHPTTHRPPRPDAARRDHEASRFGLGRAAAVVVVPPRPASPAWHVGASARRRALARSMQARQTSSPLAVVCRLSSVSAWPLRQVGSAARCSAFSARALRRRALRHALQNWRPVDRCTPTFSPLMACSPARHSSLTARPRWRGRGPGPPSFTGRPPRAARRPRRAARPPAPPSPRPGPDRAPAAGDPPTPTARPAAGRWRPTP